MMMFDDKVGGWGWLNAEVIKKYMYKEKTFFVCAENMVVANLFHCIFFDHVII